jgi:fermentation-respiration switch protein FrsA (DUF1100 family)
MPKLTRIPLLFLAGERDEVIPAIHMKQLHASAEKASVVVWKSFPHGMHNDTCLQRGYFDEIQFFVKKYVYSTPSRRGRRLGDSHNEKLAEMMAVDVDKF